MLISSILDSTPTLISIIILMNIFVFPFSEALARGTKWVGMVGEMIMLSVGPLDQVIAIQVNYEFSTIFQKI